MSEAISKVRNIINNDKFLKISVFILVILGFILRLFWIIKVPNLPISDYKTYYDIAVSIVRGETHPLFGYQGIGYPLLLAVFFYLFGSTDIFIAKIINVILSTGTLVIIYMISKKLFKNNIAPTMVLLIVTLLPNYIAYNNVLGTETFFLFLFTTILLIFLSDFNSKIKFPLLGILIGLTALTKPQFLVYPVLLALIYYFKRKSLKEILMKFGIVTIFMIMTILPMTIFNYKIHGEIIPVSYNGGYVLYINNNSQNSNGMYMDVVAVEPTEKVLEELQNKGIEYGELNAKASSVYQNAAINWILENPITFVKVGLLRVKATFFSGAADIQFWSMGSVIEMLEGKMVWNEYARNIYTFTFLTDSIVFFITIFGFLFTIFGWVYLFRRMKIDNKLFIISIPTINITFFILISFFFEGQSRYNYPILFLFIIAMVFIIRELYIRYINLNIEEFE